MTSTAGRGEKGQSLRTLVTLLHRSLGRSWAIRVARFCAGMLSIGVVMTAGLSAGGIGANDSSLSLVAWSALILAWIPGALSALALATPPKDVGLAQGIAALAAARGFDSRRLARAETVASVRLVAEVILAPLIVMGSFVFVIMARGGLVATARPLVGSILFGLATAIVLGLVTSICRSWGGAHGRFWLVAIVLGPWLAAEVALSGRVAPYVSIPGLLGSLWEALAAVPT